MKYIFMLPLLFWSLISPVDAKEASYSGDERRPVGAIRLAVTFDDLPWVGVPSVDGDAAEAVNRMAAVLNVHGVPATGFVVCENARRNPEPVEVWASWGLSLGNHSSSHLDLNNQESAAWLDDVQRCDDYLKANYGAAYRHQFRFPLLHQGDTPEKKQSVRRGLEELGLTVAHVSVDTSDWILTQAHARAMEHGDDKARREVGREFIRHILAAVQHADSVAQRKTGRQVPQVLLLHANALVDDYLDELLLTLRRENIVFVPLDEALRDPVYRREDRYTGPKGLSWLYRMAPASPADAGWDDNEAESISRRFAEFRRDAPTIFTATDITQARVDPAIDGEMMKIFENAGKSERLRSLLVARDGELIAEGYFNGAGRETPANLKSVTKSIMAALVGVALGKGWIDSVDDAIGKYLPELAKRAPRHAAVTIRQLLTMSSGIEPVDYGAIQQTESWVSTLLQAQVSANAAGEFRYDTPVLQLLSAVLQEASGRNVREIANRDLLAPLNARIDFWRHDPEGLAFAGNDAYMTPRDMLRFGEWFRTAGQAGGKQLVPAAFAAAARSVQIHPRDEWINHRTLPVRGYGYLFWLTTISDVPVVAALGHGGQMILIAPDMALVVVVTSRWPGPSATAHYQHITLLLEERLFPLLKASASTK